MESIQYEYRPLPNNWEGEMLSWDRTYEESLLGGKPGSLTDVEHDVLAISLHVTIESMMIEHELEPVMMPEDVYQVYLARYLEERNLPCQQLT
jgi:hypothetical protein